MRIERVVTALSWIPSEAIEGSAKIPFVMGIGRYDDPPPALLDDLDALHARGGFRFANELKAWVDVRNGAIVDHGFSGRGLLSDTHFKIGPMEMTFVPTGFPMLQSVPEATPQAVTFEQTAGGRPGMPAPRTVRGAPFVQVVGPNCWTTLSLTIAADGTSEGRMTGASTFPRHWVYDETGRLAAKSGRIDFDEWYAEAFGPHSPWGGEESPALVAEVESSVERRLSGRIMRGGSKPEIRKLPAGTVVSTQGESAGELYLVLDGMLSVEVDGDKIAEVGPGSVLGERAILEGGTRTATLRTITPAKLAVANVDQIDRASLENLASRHRREETEG